MLVWVLLMMSASKGMICCSRNGLQTVVMDEIYVIMIITLLAVFVCEDK